jgi:hypothetical protein
MITKEELKSKIDFSADSDEILKIFFSKTKGSGILKKLDINGDDYPCNFFTFSYVITKFNMKNMLIRELQKFKNHKPSIEMVLYVLSQTFMRIKRKFSGPDKDLSIDALIFEIVSDELLEESKIHGIEYFNSLNFDGGEVCTILL